jgi:hypothetical protein
MREIGRAVVELWAAQRLGKEEEDVRTRYDLQIRS